jgi:hypothetical protein
MTIGIIKDRFEVRSLVTCALRTNTPNRFNFKREDGKRRVQLRNDIVLIFEYHPNKRVINVTYQVGNGHPLYLTSYHATAKRADIMLMVDRAIAGIMFDRLYLSRQLHFYHTRARSLGTFEFRHVIEEVKGSHGIAAQCILESRRIRYLGSCAHGDGKFPVFIG